MIPTPPRLLCALLVLGFVVSTVQAEGPPSYRWVDEHGQVHYGDAVPPEYAAKEQRQLNKEGITVKTIEGAKTPEQRAEEVRRAQLAAEAQRRAELEKQRDRMLLSTFGTEEDLVMTRDGKVSALKAAVRAAHNRSSKLRGELRTLQSRAADAERAGQTPPGKLAEDMARARDALAENQAFIATKEREQIEVRKAFDVDLARYRELKGTQPAANVAP
jgi:hypothetical protein